MPKRQGRTLARLVALGAAELSRSVLDAYAGASGNDTRANHFSFGRYKLVP